MENALKRRRLLQTIAGLPVAAIGGASSITTALQAAEGACAPDGGGWWESASASIPVFIRDRPGKDAVFPIASAEGSARRLDELRDRGVAAIEVYAPAEGGNSFLGLDTINRYRFEPKAGTMDDFRRLIRQTHERGMKIVSIDNLGYSSVEAVDFLKACDDVRAGKDTRESRFFVWGDSADAPIPGSAGTDRYFMVRPRHLPGRGPGGFVDTSKQEFWQYSERAGKYYWTKWDGVDLAGNKVRLPQYNWGSAEFQEEAEKIVRYWMDTGIDGMLIDAVNWYVGCTWESNRKRMTDVISSYGKMFSQPEGSGAFRDDPVAWVTDGGWTCIQDYGLAIYWERGSNVVTKAIESGDPQPIEPALARYHDRVVDAGGTLYFNPPKFEDARKSHLAMAFAAAAGELICLAAVIDNLWSPVAPDEEEGWILKLKAKHPAMYNLSRRRSIRAAAPDRHYALLRSARNCEDRVLTVMNFQPEPQSVEVDLSGIHCRWLTDLRSGKRTERQVSWSVPLPAHGYSFFHLS